MKVCLFCGGDVKQGQYGATKYFIGSYEYCMDSADPSAYDWVGSLCDSCFLIIKVIKKSRVIE